MIIFPNCKINLGLHVIQKRDDGYHNVETVFYPLPLEEVLEVIPAKDPPPSRPAQSLWKTVSVPGIRFSQSGLVIEGDIKENLCLKAYALLKKDFPALPAVEMHLHKIIPAGAGLGGGSSDAAFTLRLLNDTFHLELSTKTLLAYAAQLGSDCPFFMINQPCYATGRGEILQPFTLDLSAYSWVLVYPGIHIHTVWAFSQVTPTPPAGTLTDLLQQPITSWKDKLKNDFETIVCRHHPALQTITPALYANGALYASMTGSGSCFYGVFPKNKIPPLVFDQSYSVFTIA